MDGKKRCRPLYRRSFEPFTYVQTVDVNREQRETLVELCTQRACLRDYGNLYCEPDKPAASAPAPATAQEATPRSQDVPDR